jgi:hypothetical protein
LIKERPAYQTNPLGIIFAHYGPERLLGYDVAQNDVILGLWKQRSSSGQCGTIGGERVAFLRRVCRASVRPFRKSQKRDFKFSALEKIRGVLF